MGSAEKKCPCHYVFWTGKLAFKTLQNYFLALEFQSAGYKGLAHINLNIDSGEEEEYGPVIAVFGDK